MARQTQIFGKQTFQISAPDAQKVLLVGDFTEWQKHALPMKKGADGTWKATVGLPQGEHHYPFIVDGVWHDDPECPVCAPNPYGGHNMVRKVG